MDDKKIIQKRMEEEARPGEAFMMMLLMKEECKMAQREKMSEVMKKYLGDTDCLCFGEELSGFAVKKYPAMFKGASVFPKLMISGCGCFRQEMIGEKARRQMWSCLADRDEILEKCRYQMVAYDEMAATLQARDRADMLMDYMEALVEIFPGCEAVYFMNSGKLIKASEIRNHEVPREERFIYFAVNTRFFYLGEGDSMVVDTLGMGTLLLPDLQYHFQGIEPGWIISYAYNLASYIFKNNNPIKEGDTIDSIDDGELVEGIQWTCSYRNALVKPSRMVIDIFMGENGVEAEEEEVATDNSSCAGFLLLSSAKWSEEQFRKDLEEEWGISYPLPEEDESTYLSENKAVLAFDVGKMTVAISLIPIPVQEKELEEAAANNWRWKDAPEVVESHQAYLLVGVVNPDKNGVETAKLFTKVNAVLLKQDNTLGVYTSDTVFKREFYLETAEGLKSGILPVLDWVFFGIVHSENGVCAYTCGMNQFGKDEMEILDSRRPDLEVYEMLYQVAKHVLENDAVLRDGDMICLSEEQEFPVKRTEGVLTEGISIKISY